MRYIYLCAGECQSKIEIMKLPIRNYKPVIPNAAICYPCFSKLNIKQQRELHCAWAFVDREGMCSKHTQCFMLIV